MYSGDCKWHMHAPRLRCDRGRRTVYRWDLPMWSLSQTRFARLDNTHSHLLGQVPGPSLPLWNKDQRVLLNVHDLVHRTPISQNYRLLRLLKTCFVHGYLIEGSPIPGLVCSVCGYMHMRVNPSAYTHARASGSQRPG